MIKFSQVLLNVAKPKLNFPISTHLPSARRYFHSGFPNENSASSPNRRCKLEAVKLKSRSLIRLDGPDIHQFLQGLITNDVSHLESKAAVYALFLNTQGRVLFDTIVYNVQEGENRQLVIECDSAAKSDLLKHLKIFRLRKKVTITDLEEEKESALDLWVVFDHGHTLLTKELDKEECCGPVLQQTSKRPELPISVPKSLHSFGDPRLNELGWRVLAPRSTTINFPPSEITISDELSYKQLRYTLGVGEGVKELPSKSCFPLESNGDYLHGISFQKGCYIGQELTARTHHTGVVRKRIMPFRLPPDNAIKDSEPSTLQLVTPAGKPVGKIRGICGSHGIGLIRIEDALAAPSLSIQNTVVRVEKPFWWPIEASKEKQTRQ